MDQKLYLDKKNSARKTLLFLLLISIAMFVAGIVKGELFTKFWNYKTETYIPYLAAIALVLIILAVVFQFVFNKKAWSISVSASLILSIVCMVIGFFILKSDNAHEAEPEVFMKWIFIIWGLIDILCTSSFCKKASDASVFFEGTNSEENS